MRFTLKIRRSDQSEFESKIDTTAGDKAAMELANNVAESYGATLVSMIDADGKEFPVGDTTDKDRLEEQDKDTAERVDEQDKTTTERVETQEVSPSKTADVKPDR